MTSGFTAVYLFLYCVHFFTSKLTITGTVSPLLFLSRLAPSFSGLHHFILFLHGYICLHVLPNDRFVSLLRLLSNNSNL